jgi:hypothetical protein
MNTLQIQDCLERIFTTDWLLTYTMNTTDYRSLPLVNWRTYHESPLCRLDTGCLENTSSDVLLEAMFIVQMPSNKRCIQYCCPHSRLRECLPSLCLVTTTFLYCCAFELAYRAVAWQRFGQIRYSILLIWYKLELTMKNSTILRTVQ